MNMGFENMSVRFFVYVYELDTHDIIEVDTHDIIEVDEQTFLEAEGSITYERHTVYENGVKQICLTKGL